MTVKRPHMPTETKLAACLLLLGFTWEEVLAGGRAIEFDHAPALARRKKKIVDDRMIYDPPANDPRYIRPLRKAGHAIKTNGTKATTRGSDKHEIARDKRLAERHAEFRKRLLTPGAKPKSAGKMRSRGFDKRKRPMNWRRKP